MAAAAWSWKTLPFTDVVPIPYEATFDADQFSRLKIGLIPEQEDDKWFVYYEEPHLFFHRSWTGAAAFRVTLGPADGGACVTEASLAMDVADEDVGGPDYYARLLDFLISNLLLGESKPFPMPQDFEEPYPGQLQHHVAGTRFPETPLKRAPVKKKAPWWKFW